jgi:3-methyladenine DNA glycosylase/8-oxoguanine DNA glycosylase
MTVQALGDALANVDGLYSAFAVGDRRFDGRIFVGISSTMIYCRPICRAKRPKRENCTFFTSAAAAELEGFRPCMLCRPETAPGHGLADATSELAYRAAQVLEEKCGSGLTQREIAAGLGYSVRHLRRAFTAEYSISPVDYLQTCRLLLAKNLLTETNMQVVDVAMASGFGSLRRFNAIFKERYRMAPTALRKQRIGKQVIEDKTTLTIGYRPPYLWDEILRFFAGRAIEGVEAVVDGQYRRTVRIGFGSEQKVGWLQVSHKAKDNALSVTISDSLTPALAQVLSRIKHMFDLHCDPSSVAETLNVMNEVTPNLFIEGIRVPGCFDPFEMATRAVLGQQVSVKAAGTFARRIASTFGIPIDTGTSELTHLFPAPETILELSGPIEDQLGPLGVTGTRARTIRALAESLVSGHLRLDHSADPEEEVQRLLEIKGIGKWTAGYIAMRAMGWPDVFLETDAGIKQALAPMTPKEALSLAKSWRPWRSYATISLWNTL